MTSDSNHDPLRNVISVLEALNCGALLVHRSGRIVFANERVLEMAKRPRAELVGRDLRDLYEEEADRTEISAALSLFDQANEREFHVPTGRGESLPVIVSGRQLTGPAPLSDHRIITLVDVSAQKQAEQACRVQYRDLAKLSDTVIAQAIDLKHHSERLEQRVRARTAELHDANMEAIYMLAVACEARDDDTGAHVRRMQKISEALALELGLEAAEAERIGYSAILHDVGKMHVPDSVLKKPGPLTDEEWVRMRAHTTVGERILSSKPFFEIARRIARSHHENWNGSGYPDKLRGTDIPLAARIVHVADVFDALIQPRVYKPAWPIAKAREHLEAHAGLHFDPDVIDAFRHWSDNGRMAATLSEVER
jgi:putative nucleotidyltransferase with HDIG domain/PAS domain S-box-containing protein